MFITQKYIHTICKNVLLTGILCLCGFVLRAEEAAPKWYNTHWENRVEVKVSNKQEIALQNEPVVMSGKYFKKKTGVVISGINTSSIIVTDNDGKLVPYQVDEKDNTGLYIKEPNQKLDVDDEIVFLVNVPEGDAKKFWIYFSKKGKPSIGDETSKVKIKNNTNGYGQVKVTTPHLEAIIKGPSSGDINNPSFNTHGIGNITILKVEAVPMTDMSRNWGWTLPGEWMGGFPCSANVTMPAAIISGPVRSIIIISRVLPGELAKEERLTTKYMGYTGKVIRYFKFYGNAPLIEMEDIYDRGKWNMERVKKIRTRGGMGGIGIYSNLISVGIQFPKPTTILYYPTETKGIFEKKFSNFKINKKVSVLYKKPNLQTDSWIAWVDTEDKKGLAIFYEAQGMGTVYYPYFVGNGKIEPVKIGGVYNYISYNKLLDDNLCRDNQQVRFKLAYRGLLKDDDGKQAQAYYRCWKTHISDMLKFGFIEEKE